MSDFKKEIEERFENRHKNKFSTWTSFLVRVILLVVLIMIIKFLANPKTEKFRDFLFGTKSNSAIVQEKE
ncbi:MAG: hypothetical protein KAS49_00320 [Candidatus Cloacimonetes bacterium]|nr:hypothetical protein [Candidatus Cloacimonadota bacterium]